jgi:hypothetical protein
MSYFQSKLTKNKKKQKLSPFSALGKGFQKQVCHTLMNVEIIKKMKQIESGTAGTKEVIMIKLECP